nr:MAG TPA: hypothetical protein [Caudoviricetes sp.]
MHILLSRYQKRYNCILCAFWYTLLCVYAVKFNCL